MLKDKENILPFLILSAHLIFTEKIVITITCLISILWLFYHQTFVTCRDTVRSISNKFSGNNIRILDVWRSIELTIKKSKYYEAVWNIIKMNYSSKCESEALNLFYFFFILLLISRI